MEENQKIDGADYISLENAKRLKLPFFEQVAAGFPSPASDYQHERHEKLRRLDEALDKLNREYGSESVVLGSQQYVRQQDMAVGKKVEASVFKDSIKHDFRSPCYTTRWSDVPEATYPPTLSPFPPYSFPSYSFPSFSARARLFRNTRALAKKTRALLKISRGSEMEAVE